MRLAVEKCCGKTIYFVWKAAKSEKNRHSVWKKKSKQYQHNKLFEKDINKGSIFKYPRLIRIPPSKIFLFSLHIRFYFKIKGACWLQLTRK